MEGDEQIVETIEHHEHIIKDTVKRVEKLETLTGDLVKTTHDLKENVFEVKKAVFDQGEKTQGLVEKLLDAVVNDKNIDRDYEHELKIEKEKREHEYRMKKQENTEKNKERRKDFFIKALTLLGGSGGVIYILIEAAIK